jgi:glucose-6-phosphate isomerase
MTWTITQTTLADTPDSIKSAQTAVKKLKSRSDLGFLKVCERGDLWTSSELRGRELRKIARHMVVLGMGGSSLGGRALIQALHKPKPSHLVDFIDNVDADRFWKWLKSRNDLNDSHWVIVSKSGNTIETLTMAECIDQHLRASGLKRLAAQSTIISEVADNPLTRWAKKENVAQLEIPKDVGGRFSVLTPVGLLPAAFYGLDLLQLRAGAAWAIEQDELVARLAAQSLMSWSRDEWITLFWSYSDSLKDFGLWTLQLWAESLGKAKNRSGEKAVRSSTPMSATGSSDQHSVLQQVMEGAHDKFLWFLRVKQSEHDTTNTIERNLFDGQELMLGKGMGSLFAAMASATRDALAQNGVQSLTLSTEKLDEFSTGALLMLLELVVGTIGESMDINAFDQPGVELGKKLARSILTK